MLQSRSKKYHRQAAYTLGELFFVIFILIATVGISLSLWRGARDEAHRSTCLSDVIQMQNALENYFKLEKAYPDSWLPELPLISLSSGKILMERMPINQAWFAEKNCSDSTVTYDYAPISGGYIIKYCVNGQTQQHTKKRVGIILPKAKSANVVTCPVSNCTAEMPYYNKSNQSCTSTPSNPINDSVAVTTACDACSDYGDLCSGGYLFCKPADAACSGHFAVAAPADLPLELSWSDAGLACQKYTSASITDWSLPGFATSTDTQVTTELCQLMRSSDRCTDGLLAGNCAGTCLITDRQKLINLPSLKYWSGLERSTDTAWMQHSKQGRSGYDDKTAAYSVRCIKRF